MWTDFFIKLGHQSMYNSRYANDIPGFLLDTVSASFRVRPLMMLTEM